MPQTDVIFYADDNGDAPVLSWIREQIEDVQDKLYVRIQRLEQEGCDLRRPEAAPLRDKIYELRVRHQRVNYRILYFFHGRTATVLAHGCTKEDVVPDTDIDRAARRRDAFLRDPNRHTYQDEEGDNHG